MDLKKWHPGRESNPYLQLRSDPGPDLTPLDTNELHDSKDGHVHDSVPPAFVPTPQNNQPKKSNDDFVNFLTAWTNLADITRTLILKIIKAEAAMTTEIMTAIYALLNVIDKDEP